MKNLYELKNKIQEKTLNLVTQRNGSSVYQGQFFQEKVFIKIAKNREANDRYCEILEALKNFALTPKVLNKFEWDGSSVLVMSAIEGTQFDQIFKNCTRDQKIYFFKAAGRYLGELHREIPETFLFNMRFWQDRDGLSTQRILWSQQLELMISKWMSRVNPLSLDYHEFSYQLNELLKYSKALSEPSQLTLLHCDYIGRNILVDSKNQISGVIDFDAARIGDAVYDLAKIVWVEIDFSDLELRNAFLDGWGCTYKQRVPKVNFLFYVGIQCLAAIAWTDRNPSSDGTNTIFRASAIRTLSVVLKELAAL
ncbi:MULTISPECIES: phosphotransferase family protein [Acinetobacter]|uniref:phosphotransferase family protein n=1 Tax=Acinetobacter TaxID=469 RepID=UPI000EA35488|nr:MULTISPECIES: aminoglycoside phosphotransferase family protein [Acinetobacter]RKG43751.1 aminoglycoside phosphotransferase family protein [Acinetobacter cumulans]RZG59467.1 aminoglycoside phosphotransferase family protein [Acinetobacter sp. WCHAc060006]